MNEKPMAEAQMTVETVNEHRNRAWSALRKEIRSMAKSIPAASAAAQWLEALQHSFKLYGCSITAGLPHRCERCINPAVANGLCEACGEGVPE